LKINAPDLSGYRGTTAHRGIDPRDTLGASPQTRVSARDIAKIDGLTKAFPGGFKFTAEPREQPCEIFSDCSASKTVCLHLWRKVGEKSLPPITARFWRNTC